MCTLRSESWLSWHVYPRVPKARSPASPLQLLSTGSLRPGPRDRIGRAIECGVESSVHDLRHNPDLSQMESHERCRPCEALGTHPSASSHLGGHVHFQLPTRPRGLGIERRGGLEEGLGSDDLCPAAVTSLACVSRPSFRRRKERGQTYIAYTPYPPPEVHNSAHSRRA